MGRVGVAWLCGLLLSGTATSAGAAQPAVTKPRFAAGTELRVGGTAFFVAIDPEPGAVAVTTAHGFSFDELTKTREVWFTLGRSERRASVSSRLWAPPGKPFNTPGATLRDDFLVFALDLAPTHVRPLRLCQERCNEVGQRVRILGAPAAAPHTQDDVFGRVTKAAPDQLEVRLDVPADLRGWGGGPVLRQPEGDVIGLLQAQWPGEDGVRLGVGPIDGIRDDIAQPLEGGLGRSFASYGEGGEPDAPRPSRTARTRRPKQDTREKETPSPADEDPLRSGPLLGRAGALSTDLRLNIDYPADGGIVGDPEGAFVAGRALALLGEFRRFDVVLVIDTSDSTRAASGSDVNENGVVGEDRLFGVFPTTDAGDSVLAAEVAAALRVLESFDARSTRVGLVTFSGAPLAPPGAISIGSRGGPSAVTEQALTAEYVRVEKALERVLDRGPDGLTNMTEGLRTAVRELKGFRGGISKADPESEKVVLFFTDGQPTLPYDGGARAQNVRSVLRAADQAHRARVTIHSFAIGPDALAGPVAAVEMARMTGGRFTPVRNPGDLVDVIRNVDFANLESLEVRNQTTDQPADELVQKADGGFGALVPLAGGRNVIEVVARTTDGSEAREEIVVHHLLGASPGETPQELLTLRNQVLQRRVLTLKRGRVEAERRRNDELRRGLELEIEEERAAAEARSAQQRRELRIEPDLEEASGGDPP
jgi:hypothetical protein